MANPKSSHVFLLLLGMLLMKIGNPGCEGTHRETGMLISWMNQIQDPQGSLRDWVSSPVSPCNWTGIVCDGYYLQVLQINLSNMGLSGPLNSVLGQLQLLASFNISTNNFSGDLPPEICAWVNLQVLGLHHNSFSGLIPACLSELSLLRVMDLSYNSFVSLPDSIGAFPQLSYLNVEGCALNGSIPPAVGNISTLTSLSLGGNQLMGFIPPQLSQLRGLKRMHLGYNSLVGQIPSALGLMASLTYLNLAGNKLTGAIPSTLWNIVHLEEVELFDNYLSGVISPNIGTAANLITVDISRNFLNGNIPDEIGNLKSLQVLNLSQNGLVGQIPPTLPLLPELQVLSLSLNKLTGGIPYGLGAHSNISTLDLSSNELVDAIPQGLCSSGGLSILNLASNSLYGSIPTDLQSCWSLQRISLAKNVLTGNLQGIGALPGLSYLDVSSNQLSGTLEFAQIGASATLAEIYLQNNYFTGRLPEGLGFLVDLSKLDVSVNNFTGEILPQLGNCTKLSELKLGENEFLGFIPQEIGNSKQLQVLNLSWNSLSGTVPLQLGSWLAVTDLDLSHNNLNGSIPTGLASCSLLDFLDLSYNNLSGPVPVEGVFQTIKNISLGANPHLCGGAASLKLPSCPEDVLPTSTKIVTGALVGLSVLVFAIALWWQERKVGNFHDMKETTPGEAGPNRAEDNAATGGGAVVEREVSMWEPEVEPAGNLEGDEELTVFHRGEIQSVLDDEREAVPGPDNSPVSTKSRASTVSLNQWEPHLWPWKLFFFVPDLNLTEVELAQMFVPNNLYGATEEVEMYQGVTKDGRGLLVTKSLIRIEGEELSNIVRRMAKFNHPNICKALAYCVGKDGSLVAAVYRNVTGGTLRAALKSGKLSGPPCTWKTRFDIALGIVRALHYLHEYQPAYPAPLHDRISSDEIALDIRMKPYLAVRVGVPEIDPSRPESSSTSEQMLSKSCTDGTDIYSLGVVLLELFSGQPVEASAPDQMHIVDWFTSSKQMSNIIDMMDPTLGDHPSLETINQVQEIFTLADRCLDPVPAKRPTFIQVLDYLLKVYKASHSLTNRLSRPSAPWETSGSGSRPFTTTNLADGPSRPSAPWEASSSRSRPP